jgi:hypothetical protein
MLYKFVLQIFPDINPIWEVRSNSTFPIFYIGFVIHVGFLTDNFACVGIMNQQFLCQTEHQYIYRWTDGPGTLYWYM